MKTYLIKCNHELNGAEIAHIYKILSNSCSACNISEVEGNFLENRIQTETFIPSEIKKRFERKGIVFVKQD